MTFLAPGFLAIGALAGALVVLLHFLARRRPRPVPLPTARFVPDRPARAPSRAPRPTDPLLLALRVLTVMLVASAFSRPVRVPERAGTRRIIALDRSRAVADVAEARDSARSLLRPGDALVLFDSAPAAIQPSDTRTALEVLATVDASGSLSAAILGALRAAKETARDADSLELVMVSPFTGSEWDAATMPLRREWSGRTRLVPVAATPTEVDSAKGFELLGATADDPVRAALAGDPDITRGRVRLTRGRPTAADSQWARMPGHLLVVWPARRDAADTVGAIVVDSVVMVAAIPLVRSELRGDVVARLADGTPASAEERYGDGCLRTVAFDLPWVGDASLRESARRIARGMVARCGSRVVAAPIDSARLATLRGAGPLRAATASVRPSDRSSPAQGWLLAVAVLALIAELAVRRPAQTT